VLEKHISGYRWFYYPKYIRTSIGETLLQFEDEGDLFEA